MTEPKTPEANPNAISADNFVDQVKSFTGRVKPSTDDIIAEYLTENRPAKSTTEAPVPTSAVPAADIQALIQQNQQLVAMVAKQRAQNNSQQVAKTNEPDWESKGLTPSDKELLDSYLGHSLKGQKAEIQRLQQTLSNTLSQQQAVTHREQLEQNIKHELTKSGLPEEAAIIASMYARDNNIPAREAVQHARQTVKIVHNALRKQALERQEKMPYIPGELKDRSGNVVSGDTKIETNGIADTANVLKALLGQR